MNNIYKKINDFLNIFQKNIFHQFFIIKNKLGKILNKKLNKWFLLNIIFGQK